MRQLLISALVLFAHLGGCSTGGAPISPQSQDDLLIIAWNVESGGSDPSVIAGQLKRFTNAEIFCLSEVAADSLATFRKSVDEMDGRTFESIDGTSGRDDWLQIIYNADRFELLETQELNRHRDFDLNDGNHRSPLVALFQDRTTDQQFYVVQNHLARRNEELRNVQAAGLREWARDNANTCGVIVIGDLNFDFTFSYAAGDPLMTGSLARGNRAWTELSRDGVLRMAGPTWDDYVDTNWADKNPADGKDDYPDSMLDGAFVGGPAKEWKRQLKVVVRQGDFPDDDNTSDHRPIALLLSLPRPAAPTAEPPAAAR